MRCRCFTKDIPMPNILTPKGLVIRALVLIAIFAVCHLCGLRESTGVISGTYASTGTSHMIYAFFGVAYVLLYLASVVLTPILLIAAGILKVIDR